MARKARRGESESERIADQAGAMIEALRCGTGSGQIASVLGRLEGRRAEEAVIDLECPCRTTPVLVQLWEAALERQDAIGVHAMVQAGAAGLSRRPHGEVYSALRAAIRRRRGDLALEIARRCPETLGGEQPGSLRVGRGETVGQGAQSASSGAFSQRSPIIAEACAWIQPRHVGEEASGALVEGLLEAGASPLGLASSGLASAQIAQAVGNARAQAAIEARARAYTTLAHAARKIDERSRRPLRQALGRFRLPWTTWIAAAPERPSAVAGLADRCTGRTGEWGRSAPLQAAEYLWACMAPVSGSNALELQQALLDAGVPVAFQTVHAAQTSALDHLVAAALEGGQRKDMVALRAEHLIEAGARMSTRSLLAMAQLLPDEVVVGAWGPIIARSGLNPAEPLPEYGMTLIERVQEVAPRASGVHEILRSLERQSMLGQERGPAGQETAPGAGPAL